MAILSRLTRTQRIALLFFVVLAAVRMLAPLLGYTIPLRIRLLVALPLFILAIILIHPLVRMLLWRVRRRLLVTYFLIGVLPLALVALFVSLAFNLVLSQTANYLLHAELDRRMDQMLFTARQIAQDVSIGGEAAAKAPAGDQIIVRTGYRTPADFPIWSAPGFKGVLINDSARFLAAHGAAGSGRTFTEVFIYRKLDNKLLSELMPGLAAVYVVEGTQVRVHIGSSGQSVDEKTVLDSEEIAPAPSARGFWDAQIESASPFIVQSMKDGKMQEEAIVLITRPSVLLRTLFGTLGSVAAVLAIIMLAIALIFLLVEIVAIAFSVQLTRTITRAVHDLYIGTKKVESGDFSHRIPVRSSEQLSELATSFNSMTARIQTLIAEVKEKEKLEAELEIARQVQAQLFPKDVPKIKTLELAGLCKPARVVSGDYYDFIPIQPGSTAIIIGDISGKGISAALLMASVQSSLHSQLAAADAGGISTAVLCTRLNRQLYENTPPEKYATFYCSVFDEPSGRLAYTNAGHLAPIILRGSEVIRLESNGTVVGLLPEFPYEQGTVELQIGDLLLAFTDGITEAENKDGEQFGDQRLIELLQRHRDKPLDEIIEAINAAVLDWAADFDSQDDTTLLLARRLSATPVTWRDSNTF